MNCDPIPGNSTANTSNIARVKHPQRRYILKRLVTPIGLIPLNERVRCSPSLTTIFYFGDQHEDAILLSIVIGCRDVLIGV